MDLMPVGDRYIWYCDWCDTKNVTPWVRVSEKEVCCAACHKSFPAPGKTEPAIPQTGRRRLELL